MASFIGPLPQPASHKVLHTTELLEIILTEVGELRLATLLLSQRVNSTFRDTITGSVTLQRALFFQPSLPQKIVCNCFPETNRKHTPRPRLNPFCHHPGDVNISIRPGNACQDGICMDMMSWPKRTQQQSLLWYLHIKAGWISPLNMEIQDSTASWRRMCTTDPPILIHHMRGRCFRCKTHHERYRDMGEVMDTMRERGISSRGLKPNPLVYYYEYYAPARNNVPISHVPGTELERTVVLCGYRIHDCQPYWWLAVLVAFSACFYSMWLLPIGLIQLYFYIISRSYLLDGWREKRKFRNGHAGVDESRTWDAGWDRSEEQVKSWSPCCYDKSRSDQIVTRGEVDGQEGWLDDLCDRMPWVERMIT